jgi:hypothetical protein
VADGAAFDETAGAGAPKFAPGGAADICSTVNKPTIENSEVVKHFSELWLIWYYFAVKEYLPLFNLYTIERSSTFFEMKEL